MPRIINYKARTLPLPKTFTLREFWERRNIILIKRNVWAVGDFFMHRMVFEDIKKLNSEIQVHFACPAMFFPILQDHPFIDKLVDSEIIQINEYPVTYDNSNSCVDYENIHGGSCVVHRSDIWAGHCGLTLTNHNMHLTIDPHSKERAIKRISELNTENKPTILFSPYSTNASKNMTDYQIRILVNYLREKNCFVFAMHLHTSPILDELKVPIITNASMFDLVAFVNESDYIVTTDTAFYHIAGGLGKPLLGIFGYINGKIYGKYYQSEFIQKHKDNGDWDCGPCGYHFHICPKPKKFDKHACIYEISPEMIRDGVDRMLARWTIVKEENGCNA